MLYLHGIIKQGLQLTHTTFSLRHNLEQNFQDTTDQDQQVIRIITQNLL